VVNRRSIRTCYEGGSCWRSTRQVADLHDGISPRFTRFVHLLC
jgi:hypothetical protein